LFVSFIRCIFVYINNYKGKQLKLIIMTHLTYIQLTKQRAKYNDVLRKGLEKMNISYTEVSSKYGKNIFINNIEDVDKARKFLLGISLTTPQYLR